MNDSQGDHLLYMQSVPRGIDYDEIGLIERIKQLELELQLKQDEINGLRIQLAEAQLSDAREMGYAHDSY